MKKLAAVLVAAITVVFMVSLAFAADMAKGDAMKDTKMEAMKDTVTMSGTLKKLSKRKGTILLKTADGEKVKLTFDKSLDLGKAKKRDEVELTVAGSVVVGVKVTKKARAAVGC